MKSYRLLFLAVLLWGSIIFTACERKQQGDKPPEATSTASAITPAEKGLLSSDALPGGWTDAIRASLFQLITDYSIGGSKRNGQQAPVVVFDFDNTCIRGDIGRSFYDWMIQERKFHFTEKIWEALPADRRPAIRTAWSQLMKLPADKQRASSEMQKFRKLMHQSYWSLCQEDAADKCFPWQVRFYAGYNPKELAELGAAVLEQELKKPLGSEVLKAGPDDPAPAITATGIRIHKEVRSLIMLLQQRGFQVWIVSAGPQWVVEGAARILGVDSSHVIGMRTILVEGILTTDIDPPPTFREGKVKAIEKFIGSKPVLALGDSWTDAEMLEYATHAILIDRGYADLKQKAQELGWWIQPAFPVE